MAFTLGCPSHLRSPPPLTIVHDSWKISSQQKILASAGFLFLVTAKSSSCPNCNLWFRCIQGCGSGSWKLNFCRSGSTLKLERKKSWKESWKEAGSESKLGSIGLFEKSKTEAFFHETWGRDVETKTRSGSG